MAPESAFPSDLPPRTQRSFRERNCPNMRYCWSFSLSSYSLATTDKAVLARRICMIVILSIRTALSIISLLYSSYGGRIASLVIGTIIAAIGFLFIAWCLAVIGEAEGQRTVLGVHVVS